MYLGAALAQLTSMDLLKAGYTNTVYNFGQPRVGDATYAKFAAAKVPTIRVTHNKDTGLDFMLRKQLNFFNFFF